MSEQPQKMLREQIENVRVAREAVSQIFPIGKTEDGKIAQVITHGEIGQVSRTLKEWHVKLSAALEETEAASLTHQ